MSSAQAAIRERELQNTPHMHNLLKQALHVNTRHYQPPQWLYVFLTPSLVDVKDYNYDSDPLVIITKYRRANQKQWKTKMCSLRMHNNHSNANPRDTHECPIASLPPTFPFLTAKTLLSPRRTRPLQQRRKHTSLSNHEQSDEGIES